MPPIYRRGLLLPEIFKIRPCEYSNMLRYRFVEIEIVFYIDKDGNDYQIKMIIYKDMLKWE